MVIQQENLLEHLVSLAQLDIDAFHAYSQAIDRIDLPEVKDQLELFQADHERHVRELSQEISKLGGHPPEFSKDFKGYIIQGMTALRSVTGTEGALKAMKTNEELTNRTYASALQWDLPPDVRSIIVNNREDERRHLEYISRSIDSRIWEKKTAA